MITVRRSVHNPIISPRRDHTWEAVATFNWSPVKDGKKTHVLYRAVSERELLEEPKINHSIIARATTTDGLHYSDRAPLIFPEHGYEKFGCEDPRVTKINGKYYIFYTALGEYPFNANGIKVALAISDDMKSVREKHLITPFNAKAMVLFPERINGKYVALLTMHTDLPDTNIAIAEFDSLDQMWSPEYWKKWYENRQKHIIDFHRGNDDQVEIGAVPVKTKAGWLLIYSHATHYFSRENHSFGIEAALLDIKNPRKIIGRTKGSFMTAEEYYERTGWVGNVVFPSGALIRGKNLEIYYGASDTHCCIANVNLTQLIESINPKSKPLFTRYSGNPIITPRKDKKWEAHGTLNTAAIEIDKTIHLFYRAMADDDTSTFGYASTKDGFKIENRSDEPVYVPRAGFESRTQAGNTGCEDPRLVEIKDTIYMTYTAYDGHVPRVAITEISKENFKKKDWKKWSEPLLITDGNVANKDSSVVPEKTKKGYVFFHRVNESICAEIFPSMDFHNQKVSRCIEMLGPRHGMWDGKKVGISTPPIKTKKGWLMFYHGISETSTYRVGMVLLDLKDPTIVLSRSALPVFEPKEDYEMNGIVSKVVFPCGVVNRKGTIYLYYGGADYVVGVATAKLDKLLATLTK
jgi:predicted GH43/DUF377 family glycosyl hydrolase